MFMFASSITKVMRTLYRPSGTAATKQTTLANTDALVVAVASMQSVFIAILKACLLAIATVECFYGSD